MEKQLQETLNFDGLEVLSTLGRGSKGVVFLVKSSEKLLALKVILMKKEREGDEYNKRLSFEQRVLNKLDHPLFPTLHGVLRTGKVIGYAIDYCPGRDLNSLTKNQTEEMFSDNIIRMLELNLLCGEWRFIDHVKWEFMIDDVMGGSSSKVPDDISFTNLMSIIFEDYGVDEALYFAFLSYKVNRCAFDDLPPLYIRNDRQLKKFVEKMTEVGHLIHLCVTFRPKSSSTVPNRSQLCMVDSLDNGVPRVETFGEL